MTSAVPPQLTAHSLLSQHPLTPETHATLQSRRAPRPVPQFTRQDSHTTTDPCQKDSLSVPHPCVLFSSSPYLRYILGEKQPKVNPKTKKYHLKYNKNRTPTTQGTGRSRPPSRPGPGSSTSAQPTDTDIEEYRHKSKPSRPPQPRHSFKKSPRGVQRGRGFANVINLRKS